MYFGSGLKNMNILREYAKSVYWEYTDRHKIEPIIFYQNQKIQIINDMIEWAKTHLTLLSL